MTQNIKIGVIADDFTGAGDAASFLVKSGLKTVMLTEIPDSFNEECDAVVIALKSRSVPVEEALDLTSNALEFLNAINVGQVYFKYCSTFDSTPKGNIGPVMDYLMDSLDQKYSILAPAIPINGRKVKDGILFVNGIPLAESPMKNHPLNPMWSSSIKELMKDQSKYYVEKISLTDKEELELRIKKLSAQYDRFYLVPNYENDEDVSKIKESFRELRLLSGGSGILEHLHEGDFVTKKIDSIVDKAIILCGSCSQQTAIQVKHYIDHGGVYFKIDSDLLIDGTINSDVIFEFIEKQNKPVLVYSDCVVGDMAKRRKRSSFEQEGILMEKTMSSLSRKALENDYNRIVVAGGETSGAVSLELGYSSYNIGHSVEPGVPVLYPSENKTMSIILKSGNFGKDDFFMKSLKE